MQYSQTCIFLPKLLKMWTEAIEAMGRGPLYKFSQ